MKAYIDKQKCASEKSICKPMEDCPKGAISWVEDDDEPLGSRMEVDYEKCDGCGVCVQLCCGQCIEIR